MTALECHALESIKVSLNHLAGVRNEITMILTGLDIEAKAELFKQQFLAALPTSPAEITWSCPDSTAPMPTPKSRRVRCCAVSHAIPTPSRSAGRSAPPRWNSHSPAIQGSP